MTDLRRTPRRFGAVPSACLSLLRLLASRVLPGRALYRRFLARGGVRTVEVDVPVADLPPDLDGLRLVQLSDLHAGAFLGEDALEPVVALVRSLAPDVLCVTGDFILERVEDVHELGRVFARMPAALAAFAVFGNHDYRGRREDELVRALRRQGVTVLRDASAAVRRGGAALRVVGLEDVEESRGADLDAALAEARPDDGATVLLCHHPGVVEALPPGRFDLVLCGHTHGGQVVLPLVGSPARAWLPRPLAGTAPLPGGGLLHVNRGVGALVVPLRVGAPAEVTLLVLRRAERIA